MTIAPEMPAFPDLRGQMFRAKRQMSDADASEFFRQRRARA